MIVTAELIEQTIRDLFVKNALNSRAPLDSRTLYQLWETTGLRRDDLASGIRALTDAGYLATRFHAGISVYVMTNRPAGEGPDLPGAPLVVHPELRARRGVFASRRRALPPDALLNRRLTDKALHGTVKERRVAAKTRLHTMLPKRVLDRMKSKFQLIRLLRGEVLAQDGDQPGCAYFPVDSIVCLVQTFSDGSACEVAVVGNEGMVSISAVLAGLIAPSRAIVTHSGFAYRCTIRDLIDEFDQGGTTQKLLIRYSRSLVRQISRTVFCNRHHGVDQQVCRLLLSCADRLRTHRLAMTHEVIAGLIGTRRNEISQAVGRLKRDGLLTCERGDIMLVNRKELMNRACTCYSDDRKELERLRLPIQGVADLVSKSPVPSSLRYSSDYRSCSGSTEPTVDCSRP